jgi:hypothetical protein
MNPFVSDRNAFIGIQKLEGHSNVLHFLLYRIKLEGGISFLVNC